MVDCIPSAGGILQRYGVFPKIRVGPPKSSIHFNRVFQFFIFTFHFGGFPPIFGSVHMGKRMLNIYSAAIADSPGGLV